VEKLCSHPVGKDKSAENTCYKNTSRQGFLLTNPRRPGWVKQNKTFNLEHLQPTNTIPERYGRAQRGEKLKLSMFRLEKKKVAVIRD